MKKYINPELNSAKYELEESIAAVESGSCIDLDNDSMTDDKSSFDDLFGNN